MVACNGRAPRALRVLRRGEAGAGTRIYIYIYINVIIYYNFR